MKCSNCGAEINESTRFCEVCGQPVENLSQVQQMTDFESQGVSGQANPAGAPLVNGQSAAAGQEKRKSKVPLFICLAVLVVAVAGIVAFAMPMIKKAMMKPSEYMQYVEEKSRDKGTEKISNTFGQLERVLNISDSSRKATIQVEISDDVKSMLSNYAVLAGMQLPNLSQLKDITVEMQSGAKDDAIQTNYTLKANDESLLSAKIYTDFQAKKIYFQIPELSESYLDASAALEESANELAWMLEFPQAMKSGEVFPSAEDAEKIFERYTDILLKSIKDVEKKKDQTCEAEGVSVKADLYTAKYEGKEAAALMKELVSTLKEDGQIIGYLEKAGIDKEEFQSDLEEDLQEYGDIEDDGAYVTISDYVSGEEIIGRELRSYENKEAKEPSDVIQLFMPRDQDKMGFLFCAETKSEEIFKISGKGTVNGTVFDGEFSVESPKLMEEAGQATPGEIFHIRLSDYDIKKAETEGTGKAELTMPGIPQFSTFKMVMESSGTVDDARSSLDLSMGEQKICTLNIASTKEAAIEVMEPGADAVVYDTGNEEDMMKYLTEMDTEGVLKHVKDTTGIDLQTLFSTLGDEDITGLAPGMSSDGPTGYFLAEPQ